MIGLIGPRCNTVLARHTVLEDALVEFAAKFPAALPLVVHRINGQPWPTDWQQFSAVTLVLERGHSPGIPRSLMRDLTPVAAISPPPGARFVNGFDGRAAIADTQSENALGRVLAKSWGTIANVLVLPRLLSPVLRMLRGADRPGFSKRRRARALAANLVSALPDARPASLFGLACRRDIPSVIRAAALSESASRFRKIDPRSAALASLLRHGLRPGALQAKIAAFHAFDAGEVSAPTLLLERECLPAKAKFTTSERQRAQAIGALASFDPAFLDVPERTLDIRDGSLLYVAASSLPWHVTGYTRRTASVLRAFSEAGINVIGLTRPGYPTDRPDRNNAPIVMNTRCGGVTMHHLPESVVPLPMDLRIEVAAQAIEAMASNLGVSAIHAASDYVNAMPALLAARRLGLPFTYEVRGLWEMSKASRIDGYEGSERYEFGLKMEAEVARRADKVFAISEPLADYLRDQCGVSTNRVFLLPNCVFEDEIAHAAQATGNNVPVIGYLGSLVAYEGLDILIDAAAILKARGIEFRMRIVGAGALQQKLVARVNTLGLSDIVEIPGPVASDCARKTLESFDYVVIPRLPERVCEIVAPIKLVEAMAAGKPVIVPDLPVFLSEAGGRTTTLMFASGSAVSLADVMENALAQPGVARSTAERALHHVRRTRTWTSFVPVAKPKASRRATPYDG